MLRDLTFGLVVFVYRYWRFGVQPFKSDARVRVKERFRKFKTLILPIMLVAVGLVLIMGQPDFGSFVVIVVITMGMLFWQAFHGNILPYWWRPL